jgi:hypothetical protein
MEILRSTEAWFAAGTDRHAGLPAHPHGHTYRLRVTWAGDDATLPDDLAAVSGELDLRRLEEMMNGGSSDLPGIAAYILERLVLAHQSITEIEVTEDPGFRNATARLVRPLRAPLR